MSERVMWGDEPDAMQYAEEYWASMIRLDDYMQKQENNEEPRFEIPEVLITESSMDTKHIRIKD